MSQTQCESCSMPIESGPYCEHCASPEGVLIDFDECVARFLQWTAKHEPDLGPDEARRRTLAFMASMPAWRDHPEVRAELEA